MKIRSYRNDKNKPRPSHGDKYTKYKLHLCIMIVACIKQHLSTN